MEIKRILFATDFSEGAAHAIPYVVNLTRLCGAKLYLVYVIQDMAMATSHWYVPDVGIDPVYSELYRDMEEKAKKEIERCVTEFEGYKDIEYALLKGAPSEEILKFAEDNDIDLIIMGTHSRKGAGRVVFGSTADKVVRNSRCPVLTVGPHVRKK